MNSQPTAPVSHPARVLSHTSMSTFQVWNPQTGTCLSTMDSGYGLCCLVAPGNSHAVLGTKVRAHIAAGSGRAGIPSVPLGLSVA